MSRHKKAYDEDDMYDYDDDYDDYDDPDQSYGAGSTDYEYEQPKTSKPKESPSTYVDFVMESLGTIEITAAGTRSTGGISEARVLQMLEAYDCDVDRTLDYFLTQREKSKSTPVKTPVIPPKPPTPTVVKSSPSSSAAAKPFSSQQQQSQTSTKGNSGSAPSDLDMMGFKGLSVIAGKGDVEALSESYHERGGIENGNVSITSSAASSSSASSALLVASAPLSDDEYEPQETASDSVASDAPHHITLVVAGHVDAGTHLPLSVVDNHTYALMIYCTLPITGKSTLVGNLLYKVGSVAQRTIHKYEKESKQTGKGSFALAWVMDESESEREHGVTIDLAERELRTKHRHFSILDAPGHRDFIPNMISGAAQADMALLVIPATAGEYESSMSDGAQTREHAVLLRALGVKQIIVVVNKMDSITPVWDQIRFQRIQSDLTALLEELQFSRKSIRFVPLSGLTGENLVTLSEECPLRMWYTGKTLLDMMNSVRPPIRRIRAPLRAIVTSINAAHGTASKGCDVAISVLQGVIRSGRGVGLTSSSGAATVKKMTDAEGGPILAISAGNKGSITLVDRSHRTGEEMGLIAGMVLCKGPPMPCQSMIFKASIHTMTTLQPPIIPGSTYELYLHGAVTECRITKLYSLNVDTFAASHVDISHSFTSHTYTKNSENHQQNKHHKSTPRHVNTSPNASADTTTRIINPKCIPGNRTAKVKIEVNVRICIEPFKLCNALGRFALRAKGKTCAVGICEKVKT